MLFGFRSSLLLIVGIIGVVQAGGEESYVIKDGIKIVEHFFDLPLDYCKPDGEKIKVFARQAIPLAQAPTPADEDKLPFVLFFQGGPGFEIPHIGNAAFGIELYNRGYQVLWLDQRGTGRSTAATPQTLPVRVKTDREIAEYLKFFRADSIVKDAESIRKILLGSRPNPEDQKWTILGQSFGGWISLTYLSFHPEGLKEVFLTGGLAPMVNNPDPVYESLIHKVVTRNEIYYRKYPADVKRVRAILEYLGSQEVRLPSNGTLTPSRFQQLGIDFGFKSAIDNIHQMVFRATTDLETFGKISYKTLQIIEQDQSFDGNPLYAILHEPIYCQGKAAQWSAQKVIAKNDQFVWNKVRALPESEPVYFTGEMILPSMFDDYANLRPWKGAAEILAQDASWPPLYDIDQLSKNEVKVSTATYVNDMYVDFDLSQATAKTVKNVEQWITNEFVHDGVRTDGGVVLDHLFQLSKREYD